MTVMTLRAPSDGSSWKEADFFDPKAKPLIPVINTFQTARTVCFKRLNNHNKFELMIALSDLLVELKRDNKEPLKLHFERCLKF